MAEDRGTALVSFRLPRALLEGLGALVEIGLYDSRSAAIRRVLELLLEKHKG
ncbi:MAG: CopG family transcriptional regulator [Thermoproteus sp. CIS_19]|jgi:hypothetical protein|nr:MAG: CopG family transcriptional regulator [Thermoproteus sp. CIS_19]